MEVCYFLLYLFGVCFCRADVSTRKMMTFLTTKNILDDRSDKSIEFKRILHPNQAPPSRVKYYLARRDRLDRLLANEGDVVSDIIPEGGYHCFGYSDFAIFRLPSSTHIP